MAGVPECLQKVTEIKTVSRLIIACSPSGVEANKFETFDNFLSNTFLLIRQNTANHLSPRIGNKTLLANKIAINK
jgi:hypothetical protein